ncbi:MAG TPA: MopE-related protein, partial [Saprospiraceae bacterium]|nr:MopE-related protein [Saprospiraceae bacterium]
PPVTPVISGVPSAACQNDYGIYLPTYQDGVSGYWTGPGVYYGYYFYPYGLLGPQTLTFTPYSGQCALPAEWVIDVSSGIYYEDADGDGYGNAAVSQNTCEQPAGYVADNTDCNDNNAAQHPGAPEICNGIDDDCDGLIDENLGAMWYADADGDGYGDPANAQMACTAPAGYVADNTDCNDGNAAVHPGAAELCNNLDDDCDGEIDENVQTTFYADADGDGYGNAAVSTQACTAPAGYVTDNTDCNDANGAIHPGAAEVCNNLDDNCDGQVDEGLGLTWFLDVDGDGYGGTAYTIVACMQPDGYAATGDDCDDNNPAVHPGLTEVCNGLDDDCDGLIDDADPDVTGQPLWYADADGDGFGNAAATLAACAQPAGYVSDNTDCNDANAAIHPGAAEMCNGLDDDCDGLIDEGVQSTFYADADGDGYGDPALSIQACTPPAGYVPDNTDCNDANGAIHPNAVETCNGLDDDCDGQIDENLGASWYADADGDGYGNPSNSVTACTAPAGYVADNTDCDDTNAAVHPGAQELCNGLDDDCDGQIDEGGLCDQDGDGYTVGQGDCDDANAAVHPGAPELCDGLDNDCNGLTDENGIVIDPVIVTNVACSGGNTGSINIEVSGGAPPFAYHWSNGKTTQDIANLPAGVYTVTVTGGGCSATASATVNGKLRLVTTKTNVTCNGGSDGSATAMITGGAAPYNVLWSNGATTASIDNLSPGYYIVVVSDATGCVRTASVYIGQPPAIGISGLIQHVACNGNNNGAIDISISNGTGPFAYLWSDGSTTGDRGGLTAGTYSLTVTDANGCTRQKSFTVNQPSALTLSFTTQNVTCNGAADGELKATAGGGTKLPSSGLCNGERYCYNWSNGANTRTIGGLAPGTYTVTVTDANGCVLVGTASVSEPALLLVAGVNQELLSNGKYRLTVSATGGVTPYKYKRSPGGGFQSSNVFNNVPTGAYVITVRDKNGCESSVAINVPAGNGSREQGVVEISLVTPSGQTPASAQREAETQPEFALYPNPADNLCYLRAEQRFEQGTVRIVDAGGRLVLEQELAPEQDVYVFDLSAWPAGQYWLRLETDGQTTVKRLVVMRQ